MQRQAKKIFCPFTNHTGHRSALDDCSAQNCLLIKIVMNIFGQSKWEKGVKERLTIDRKHCSIHRSCACSICQQMPSPAAVPLPNCLSAGKCTANKCFCQQEQQAAFSIFFLLYISYFSRRYVCICKFSALTPLIVVAVINGSATIPLSFLIASQFQFEQLNSFAASLCSLSLFG